jgi:hypothetical protein
MEQLSGQAAARRGAIKTITWFAGTAALGSLLPRSAARAQAKAAKSAVQYQDMPKDGKDCDDCIQFIPGATEAAPGTCKIVEGSISPHGHCLAFTPKPGKKTT